MNTPSTPPLVYDPVKLSASMAAVAARSQKLILEFMTQPPEPAASGMAHLQAVGAAFMELTQDRKSTRLNSSHLKLSRMPSSA